MYFECVFLSGNFGWYIPCYAANKEIEMKKSRLIPQELLHSIDVLNTLNGGTSQPLLELQQHTHYREIKCAVPGLTKSVLQVEIHNNFLSIYYTQQLQSNEKGLEIPRIVYYKPIPYFIDVANISASMEDRFLCVRLPYNELANGFHKKVEINR
jgi:HSP20 family molecular chaperone IbpA